MTLEDGDDGEGDGPRDSNGEGKVWRNLEAGDGEYLAIEEDNGHFAQTDGECRETLDSIISLEFGSAGQWAIESVWELAL